MERKRIIIRNPQIYSGFCHIGSCMAFVWIPGEGGGHQFIFQDLCYSDSLETLSLKKDLYLCAGTGEEFVVQDFRLDDITNMKEIHGWASDISHLNRSFVEVKADLPDQKGMLSQKTQLKAIRTMSAMVNAVRGETRIQMRETQEAAGQLLGEIVHTPNAIINLMAVRSFDDYTYAHSINVATLALMIGHAMDMSQADLKVLGMAGLLHDVGLLKLSLDVLNKETKLSAEEFEQVRQHPQLGYDLVSPAADLDPRIRQTVLYHHEKFQGGGYPKGLKGHSIPLFARIVAIADVYDALTSPRPFRPEINPYEAVRILLSNSENQFDPEILAVFVRRMSLFPPGSMVRLNDGSEALVIRPNPGAHLRPVVRLVLDVQGKRAYTTSNLDLCQSDLYVVGPGS